MENFAWKKYCSLLTNFIETYRKIVNLRIVLHFENYSDLGLQLEKVGKNSSNVRGLLESAKNL